LGKDQLIGVAIFVVCLVIAILYTVGLFFWPRADPLGWTLQFWLIAIPVFLGFVAILAIGAWIGWTMATTPPPKPIEEITSEIEEKKEVEQEKKKEGSKE
jgi:predicted DNA-binding transcriptional regulator